MKNEWITQIRHHLIRITAMNSSAIWKYIGKLHLASSAISRFTDHVNVCTVQNILNCKPISMNRLHVAA